MKRASAALLLASLAPFGATVWAQNGQPDGPTQPPKQQVTDLNLPTGSGENLPVGVDTNTYEIGPLDVIRVSVWREQTFTDNHPVRPDGKITIPLVGDIQAAGLTPERLAGQLEEALGEWIQAPDVTVSVMAVNSKRYTVSGLVLRPGPYPMPTPIRVFEALTLTGGFQQWADTKHIVIIRADGQERFEFNFNDYVKGKNTQQNIFLRNGDTIWVHD